MITERGLFELFTAPCDEMLEATAALWSSSAPETFSYMTVSVFGLRLYV